MSSYAEVACRVVSLVFCYAEQSHLPSTRQSLYAKLPFFVEGQLASSNFTWVLSIAWAPVTGRSIDRSLGFHAMLAFLQNLACTSSVRASLLDEKGPRWLDRVTTCLLVAFALAWFVSSIVTFCCIDRQIITRELLNYTRLHFMMQRVWFDYEHVSLLQ